MASPALQTARRTAAVRGMPSMSRVRTVSEPAELERIVLQLAKSIGSFRRRWGLDLALAWVRLRVVRPERRPVHGEVRRPRLCGLSVRMLVQVLLHGLGADDDASSDPPGD